jgi:uncharacterized protein YcbK (DUF882 family)
MSPVEKLLRYCSDEIPVISGDAISRRGFLKVGALAAGACVLPEKAAACTDTGTGESSPSGEKVLSLYNTHTGESFSSVYRAGEAYLREALEKINLILRDHRTDQIKPIDVRLLDLLYALGKEVNVRSPFHVISGYRSPKTNSGLRNKNPGVAKSSLHIKGKAVDVRLPGVDLPSLRKAAIRLRGGGVGYYSRSDFLHLDIGRVRYW